jgi:3-hydroxyisobutyrate dehydrogenase-like beta-hydroxyacid dehydrogenase
VVVSCLPNDEAVLMNKDFRLILGKAAELGAPMPLAAAAHQINAARTAVNGEEDFSSVIDEMERLARVRRNFQPVGGLSRLNSQPAR